MIPYLKFKAGVTLGDPPTAAQCRLIAVLDAEARRLGQSLTVTCGREAHDPSDPHSRGQALDVRTSDISEAQTLMLFQACRSALGPAFTVLYEVKTLPNGVLSQIATENKHASGPHLHIQVKRGTIWPPDDTTIHV